MCVRPGLSAVGKQSQYTHTLDHNHASWLPLRSLLPSLLAVTVTHSSAAAFLLSGACACRAVKTTAYHSFAPVTLRARPDLWYTTRSPRAPSLACCASTILHHWQESGKKPACTRRDPISSALTALSKQHPRPRVAHRRKGPITQPRIYDDPTLNLWAAHLKGEEDGYRCSCAHGGAA